MAVMRHSCGKGRSIVESVWIFAFGLLLHVSQLFSLHPNMGILKHTSSTCVRKASISSQRLRMRSSSLGKSIDMAKRGVVEVLPWRG